MTIQIPTIEESYSIFQQPWWLEAVAPGMWDEVVVKDQMDTVARWPFIKKKKFFFDIISQPPLTQHLGPWIKPTHAKYCNLLSREQEIFSELIDALPSYDFLLQNFHYSLMNWLPFYWKNFKQTTRYTYILHDIKNLEFVWKNFRENIRREIRKAQQKLEIKSDLGIDIFYNVCTKTYDRQNKKITYTLNLLRRIDDVCISRNCRQLFFARDMEGNIHAAIYIVFDKECAYYLLGGGDPTLRSSGAHSLLMWEAIQFASQFVDRFDFEGSMIQPIERFFRSFGAKQVPYFHLTHAQGKLSCLRRII
jgi:hypothetical protein